MILDGFIVVCDGRLLTESSGFRLAEKSKTALPDGARERRTTFYHTEIGLEVTCVSLDYPALAAVVQWIDATNRSEQDIHVSRIDSYRGFLPAGAYTLRSYESAWGKEFSPVTALLDGARVLQTTAGRSSHGMHPWFALSSESGGVLALTIAWSGNWIARFEPAGEGWELSGGLSDEGFGATLRPGDSVRAPAIISVSVEGSEENAFEEAAVQLQRLARTRWCPTNAAKEGMPVAWNHWWPYEDTRIDEEVFKKNVDICARLGFDFCTLDAGWFGRQDKGERWWRLQGDWRDVNSERFPSGLAALGEYTHAKGLKFGVWCEIEASGVASDLARDHPDFLAQRDGAPLGYVCLGNPDSVRWAEEVLVSLVEDYGADWIKIDFNLDPGLGCNRTDHGHGEGDGLYRHYIGYYAMLDSLRLRYPDLIVENCSSGGLRADWGIARHAHVTFLSDPDESVHALQVAWGASTMFHPSSLLQFSWSQRLDQEDGSLIETPILADMPRHKLDYILRVGMLNQFACSYRLPDWPAWCLTRLGYHVARYKSAISPFVRDGDVYRLTAQPLRDGGGDRWSVLQYVREGGALSLLMAFRLPGGEPERRVRMRGLEPDTRYRLSFEDSGTVTVASGHDLMQTGLLFAGLPEEGSEIVEIAAEP